MYNFSSLYSHFFEIFSVTACPACNSTGHFTGHGQYWKYYYRQRIDILRLRCGVCRTTHAVIPAFSLPNTSIGTKEAEDFLFFRENDIPRRISASYFLEAGHAPGYPRQLERMLTRCQVNAKALFPHFGDHTKLGLQFIYSISGETDHPLHDFNLFCLAHNINSVFCSRANILHFKKNTARSCNSHNKRPP